MLAQVNHFDDQATNDVVSPLLGKTAFPDDDGEDAPPEPGDGADANGAQVTA